MAAALQTPRHVYDERVRQPIHCVMAARHPRSHTDRLGAEYAVVGDWQTFVSLYDSPEARQHSFYEISSKFLWKYFSMYRHGEVRNLPCIFLMR
jgi:hypothetical protein